MSSPDLCFLPATELAHRMRQRELSASEVMTAHLRQIERVNPTVNAIVTLVAEQALMQARAAVHEGKVMRLRFFLSSPGDVAEHLAGLPSTHTDDDEDAKRFDMLVLRRQLAQLEGDVVAFPLLLIRVGVVGELEFPPCVFQEVRIVDADT